MLHEYINSQYSFPFMENVEMTEFAHENPQFLLLPEGPRDLILKISRKLVGFPSRFCFVENKRYISNKAFSCNELVLFVLQETQASFPNLIIPDVYHVNEMWDRLGISIDEKYARPGDLVFYGHHHQAPRHVGIFAGISKDGQRYMIDSEGETGGHVVFSIISKNYRNKRFVDNPLHVNGLIGFKRITVKTTSLRWPQSPIR